MNLLFVCKFNRFRSVLAEGMFNKINTNKSIKVKSGGMFKGRPISSITKKIAKNLSIDIKPNPEGIDCKLLVWEDITIIVADDVPSKLFKDTTKYVKKVVTWDIPDAEEHEEEKIKITVKAISLKVEKLIKELAEN
jgi:protein-tyrosine-phosphatase